VEGRGFIVEWRGCAKRDEDRGVWQAMRSMQGDGKRNETEQKDAGSVGIGL